MLLRLQVSTNQFLKNQQIQHRLFLIFNVINNYENHQDSFSVIFVRNFTG
jgi:hypothetical protein